MPSVPLAWHIPPMGAVLARADEQRPQREHVSPPARKLRLGYRQCSSRVVSASGTIDDAYARRYGLGLGAPACAYTQCVSARQVSAICMLLCAGNCSKHSDDARARAFLSIRIFRAHACMEHRTPQEQLPYDGTKYRNAATEWRHTSTLQRVRSLSFFYYSTLLACRAQSILLMKIKRTSRQTRRARRRTRRPKRLLACRSRSLPTLHQVAKKMFHFEVWTLPARQIEVRQVHHACATGEGPVGHVQFGDPAVAAHRRHRASPLHARGYPRCDSDLAASLSNALVALQVGVLWKIVNNRADCYAGASTCARACAST